MRSNSNGLDEKRDIEQFHLVVLLRWEKAWWGRQDHAERGKLELYPAKRDCDQATHKNKLRSVVGPAGLEPATKRL